MRFVASGLERHFGSFKFRLAAYFLLLALLPLVGAVWAFSDVAGRAESGRAEARMSAALRIAAGEFQGRVALTEERATSLARATALHFEQAPGDRPPIRRFFAESPDVAFFSSGRVLTGSPPPRLAVQRFAPVEDQDGRRLGRVVAHLALDEALVADLRDRVGPQLHRHDRLALVSDGRTIGGPAGLEDLEQLPTRDAVDLELDGERYRALAAPLVQERPEATLVVLTRTAAIEAQAAELRRRMLLLAAMALSLAAGLAYILGRTIVTRLGELAAAASAVSRGDFSSRVPVHGRDEFASLGQAFNDMASDLEARLDELASERGKTQTAVERFGEALAATHNPLLLLPVVVDSMVEATGAAGARLIVDGEEVARSGDPDAGREPLAIALGSEEGPMAGLLLLTPPEPDFTEESRELAYWLASQARTALENATLHKSLELAAVTDVLTELPNRRQFDESLAGEILRVERFGGSVAVVFADLDDFKQVNDRYGHLAGDDVLRAFAQLLRETVREVDTAARYGGEEFALLLPGTDAEGAAQVAERIRAEMAGKRVATYPGPVLSVTASFGIAAFPDSPTEESVRAAADEALYRAKASGKNRVAVARAGAPRPATVRREA